MTGPQRKFRQGELIDSLPDLISVIRMGLYVYFNHKPMHPKWMIHWSLAQLEIGVRNRRFRYALLNHERHQGAVMDEQTKAEIEAMITERLIKFHAALVERGQISTPTDDSAVAAAADGESGCGPVRH